MDAREKRLAENETLFREVNERIEALALTHGHDKHVYDFYCECSNVHCDLRLSLPLSAYERARSDAAVFLVAIGHELPEIEDVVLRGDGFQFVKKHGEAAEIAEKADPRTSE
jgi:hypothetical protein